MSRATAKKYAKVLIQNTDKKQVGEIKDFFLAIKPLFKEEKFKDTILSPLITSEEKYELLFGKESHNKALSNLIKLLIEKNRLTLVPYIYEELRVAGAIESNNFEGYIYSSEKLDSNTLEELKNNISKKVDSKVDFKQVKSDGDSFRVEVPDLGLEISFSQERLKSQLIQHILRGI